MKRLAVLAFGALMLGGCGPYVLRGVVVDGPASGVRVVPKDDAALTAAPVTRATYELTMDPESLGRETIAAGIVGHDGAFAIPVRTWGAGFLEYDFELVVRAEDRNSAVYIFRLPGEGKRLLVTLARGPDRYAPRDDPSGDFERFGSE